MAKRTATKIVFNAREDWLEARRGGIGGSDAAAIIGVDPYKSALEVYADKLGLTDGKEDTEAMAWGRRLEPLVADAYGEETGRDLIDHGVHFFQSDQHPFLRASIDREIVSPVGVLSIKTSSYITEQELREEIPLHWQTQLQHELMVRGMEFGSFAVLLKGQRLRWVDAEANASFQEALFEKEEAFWKLIVSRDPPPPDASESATKILKKLYPKDSGMTVSLSSDAILWDERRAKAAAEIKKWEEVKAAAENQIKAAMGDATFGIIGGVRYSWRWQKRAAYEVAESEARVLRRLVK